MSSAHYHPLDIALPDTNPSPCPFKDISNIHSQSYGPGSTHHHALINACSALADKITFTTNTWAVIPLALPSKLSSVPSFSHSILHFQPSDVPNKPSRPPAQAHHGIYHGHIQYLQPPPLSSRIPVKHPIILSLPQSSSPLIAPQPHHHGLLYPLSPSLVYSLPPINLWHPGS